MFLAESPKIAFVMPCAAGVSPRCVQSALQVVANAWENGFRVKQIGITERTLIHSARNWMSKEFLAGDAEWLFWMDSDMVLEPRTLTVMMRWADRLQAKFLSGIYYQRMGEHRPVMGVNTAQYANGGGVLLDDEYSFMHVAVDERATIPFKVDMVGFGCVLLHRSVFDKLVYPYFRFLFNEDPKKSESYVSEDTYFCAKARKAGVDIWAIPELKCGHLGQEPVISAKDFQIVEKDCAAIKVEAHKSEPAKELAQ